MKKLAIVSSYSESCGNAAFTRVLKETIEKYSMDLQVDVIDLNLTLLQSVSKSVRKLADRHISDISIQLKTYDFVNIQFEAGLYGSLPKDIINRVKKLIESNTKTSITFHSPRLISSTPANSRGWIKKLMLLKIKTGLKELVNEIQPRVNFRLNDKIIKICVKNNSPIIVHTDRSKKIIGMMYSYENVHCHPLFFVDKKQEFKESGDEWQNIANQFNKEINNKLIGIFGYISSYKGHVDAINAISILPDNYKLLIFGRQHPQSIKSTGEVDIFINKLQKLILEKKLIDKVFFMGELTDESFMNVLTKIDCTWMPYYENGQDGSGIASLSLELSRRVLCSHSLAFDELFKLVKYYNYKRFDIGNYVELASKTKQMLDSDYYDTLRRYDSNYSIVTQAKLYTSVF